MSEFDRPYGRPALLWGTVKAAAAIAGLSTLAASWLSTEPLDRNALARLAGTIAPSGGAGDPTTTGSLAQAANGGKLDPCTGQRRR